MPPLIKSFFIAQIFLTRIPTPKIAEMKEEEISSSILYYPVVGFFIGLFLILVAELLSNNVGEDAYNLVAAIIIMLWVFTTGALHLDGLADTADGLVGGQGSVDRTLEIMKDPVSGPIGIASIVLILLLKYSAVVAILNSEMSYWSLLLAPVVARAVAIGLLTYSPVSQSKGLAFELKKKEHPEIVALILVFIAVIVYFATSLIILMAISLLVFAIRYWALARLKGVTGDILGLSIEMTEALFLVVAVLVLV
ncbi:MAG: adenosylcobinamide-GDP ribazoletransferase [Cocleimonas sp.]|nr:adenosylcobinamide-GDP ribazoletransferase [Cocleimonas sp.]